jgi:opacity protein-like surface antigen
MKKIVTAAALLAASLAAHAQFYGEVGYSVTTINNKSDSTKTYEAKPKALRGLVGYDFTENLALEGIVGFGVGESNVTKKTSDGSTNVGKVKLNNVVGLFITPKVQIIDGLEASLRLGVARTSLKTKDDKGSDTQISTSTAYGLGVRYMIDSQFSINADYMDYGRVGEAKNFKAKGFTIGAGYKF